MEREQLHVMRLDGGEAVFGWLATGVFYTRFQGALSGSLGVRVSSHLDTLLARADGCRYFSDCSGASTYDFAARNSLVRVLFNRRKQFESFVVLATGGVTLLAARAVAPMFGAAMTVYDDPRAFQAELQRAVPLVSHKLDPKGWAMTRSSLPPTP